MPESPRFVAYAVDLLSPLGGIRARAMFGGHGIYCGELMIGLVDDDEVFLKTDEATRARFVEAGCRPWVYAGQGREMVTSYYRPPDEAHEDPEAMLPWGKLALEAALRAARAKAAKGRGKAAKSAKATKGGKAPKAAARRGARPAARRKAPGRRR